MTEPLFEDEKDGDTFVLRMKVKVKQKIKRKREEMKPALVAFAMTLISSFDRLQGNTVI